MTLKSAKEISLGGKITEAGNARAVKTGSWKSQQPVLDLGKCAGCLKCAAYCPDMAIKIKETVNAQGIKKNVIAGIDLDHCKGCGICAHECPLKAIAMEPLE